MRRFFTVFSVLAMLLAAGCATGRIKENRQRSAKKCDSQMWTGSHIPEEVCTTAEEDAARDQMEVEKAKRAIHRPGFVAPDKPGG